jgi:predicted permease
MLFRNLLQDMRYALRQLRRAPGFAFTVVVTLALSVGVATAVFCVIDDVILRPLPYMRPERIVFMDSHSGQGYQQPASWPAYKDERAQAKSFQILAGYFKFFDATMESPSGPVVLNYVRTSDNFFDVFGVRPVIGRTFLPGEQEAGKNDVMVLSYQAWQSHFDGSRDVLGKAVRLNGRVFTVVGVMPAEFRFPLTVRDGVYTPVHLDEQPWMQSRGGHWLQTVARIRDGFTMEQAQADINHVFGDMGKAYPNQDAGRVVRLQLLGENVSGKSKGPLWTLLGAVLAVLAIGCVNVAGLLLARGVRREREMAMRTAIGAGRLRLVRQVLTEGLMLALVGAAGGVVVAWAMLRVMRAFLIKALARGADVHLDWTVLAAAIAIAVVASLAASLYPALRLSSVDPNRALKAGDSAGSQRGQHRLRSGFVIAQVALTMVLLVVAGLLLRAVSRYRHAELGFDPEHILAADLHASPDRYAGRDVFADFYQPFLERVSHLPGVEAAGLINMLPIESYGSNTDVHITGQPPYPPDREMLAEARVVTAGYFDTMGASIHHGRALSPQFDVLGNKSSSVVVNEAFVSKFLPAGYGPTTPHIDDSPHPEEKTAIVGVTGNLRQNIFDPPLAEMDYLLDQVPVHERTAGFATMSLVVRTSGDPVKIVPALRAALHEIDSTVPLADPRTMSEIVSESLVFERMESWLFGIFASLAVVLAMVGLYGLVSHEVEQGTRDIGVRMALGATRKRILAMVLSRVTWMLAAGAIVGLVLTVVARKVIGMVIYFDAQKEAGGFLLLALLLVVAGLVAALIPAARAASIEPMQALRSE